MIYRAPYRNLALLPLILFVQSCFAGHVAENRNGVVSAVIEVLGIDDAGKASMALERSFDDPLTVVTRVNGAEVKQSPENCRKLLAVQSSIVGVRPTADWPALQDQLAACAALRWLTTMTLPQHNALPEALKQVRSTALWSAGLWPDPDASSNTTHEIIKGSLLAVSGLRIWKQVVPKHGSLESLSLISQDYLVSVQLLARGDFNGDGWSDWLLLWRAKAASGSWYESRSLVVSRMTPDGSLVELSIPEH